MNVRLVRSSALSAPTRLAMRRLLAAHFEGVTADGFEEDLARKNWVILMEDACDRLVGFSTLAFTRTRYDGRPISVVCSGDTIVDRSAWGSSGLFRGWIGAIHRLRARRADEPTYWLLIVSGFRTYRLLPLFWERFYPRHDRPTPPERQRLLDQLAGERYGAAYDGATGLVRFDRPQVLTPDLRDIAPVRLSDPDVAFFAARNPGHARGDELVCLTDLADENLTRAGRRMATAGARCPVAAGVADGTRDGARVAGPVL